MSQIDSLIKAAYAGGEVLKKYFGQALNPVEKSVLWDFQTEADLQSEKSILEILKQEFPGYNIFTEESGKFDKGSDYTLVINPLDGTNNFVLGIPNFSVSLGLLYKTQAVAGVIYQPLTNQTYTAEKNKGAFLNNQKISVNKVTDPKKITIAYTCGYHTKREYLARVMNDLVSSQHKRILLNWSPAYDYCLLACGKIESMITDGIEVYDYTAGKLIAKEAGAQGINFSGIEDKDDNNSFILSNNPEVNQYVLNIIKPLQNGRTA